MTKEFREQYALLAGIEGTLSEGVRGPHLRRTRYNGLAKTRLQHLLTATAINLKRIFRWLVGIPMDATRVSRFAWVMAESVSG